MKETRCGGHLTIYSVSIVFGFAGVGGRSPVGPQRRSPRSPSLARRSSNRYLFLVSFLTVLPTSELRGSTRDTRDAGPFLTSLMITNSKLNGRLSSPSITLGAVFDTDPWCTSLLLLPFVVLRYFYRPGCQMITIFLRALFPEHLQLPK